MRVGRRRVEHGAAVFRQGDPANAVFLLESGRVRLTRTLEDGTSVTLLVAEAGEAFAEAASAERYHCDAVAETDLLIHALPKAALLSALAADPQESLALAMSRDAGPRPARPARTPQHPAGNGAAAGLAAAACHRQPARGADGKVLNVGSPPSWG